MEPHVRINPQPTVRKALYGVVFLLLIAAAAVNLWTGTTARAADSQVNSPTGSTIPPGGTIPPPGPPDTEKGQVNILHIAPFDPDIIDTGVQICDEEGNTVTDYLYYQQQTGYINLRFGTYDWVVTAAGSNCATSLLDLPPFNVRPGARLLLILFGDNDSQPLDSMLLVERAGEYRFFLPYMINE